jgi:hypothetical protein
MAFSNTYDTTNPGSAVSNREDLTDVLSILAPEETPILSSLNKQKANATFVEWTVDSLAAPVTSGIREGADVTTFTDKFAGRARLGNYVQKFRRDFQVSDLQEAVDSVGPAKIAQAEAKSIRELKRDIEATLASANDRAVEDGSPLPTPFVVLVTGLTLLALRTSLLASAHLLQASTRLLKLRLRSSVKKPSTTSSQASLSKLVLPMTSC